MHKVQNFLNKELFWGSSFHKHMNICTNAQMNNMKPLLAEYFSEVHPFINICTSAQMYNMKPLLAEDFSEVLPFINICTNAQNTKCFHWRFFWSYTIYKHMHKCTKYKIYSLNIPFPIPILKPCVEPQEIFYLMHSCICL